MDRLVEQPTAALGYKEVRRAVRSKLSLPPRGSSRMQGQQGRLAELALPDRQHALVQVDRSPIFSDSRMPDQR